MLEQDKIKKDADIVQEATLQFIDVFQKLKMTPNLAKIALTVTLEAIEIAEKEDPTCN